MTPWIPKSPALGITHYLAFLLHQGLLPLAASGLIALLCLYRVCRDDDLRVYGRVFLAWTAGLLFVSLAVPAVDQMFARQRGATPLQFDLPRGLRYLVPFLLLAWFWPLRIYSRRQSTRRQEVLVRLAWLLAMLWFGSHPPVRRGVPWIRDDRLLHEVLLAVRSQTPPGARILPFEFGGLAVRYGALRPVVYDRRDGGAMAYVSHRSLLDWHRTSLRYDAVQALPWTASKLAALADFGHDLGAEFLLLQWPSPLEIPPDMPVRTVAANEQFALMALLSGRQDGVNQSRPPRP